MSRLVMLPNARRVPEFPPVSPVGKPGMGLAAVRDCQWRSRLRAKSPEADYLASVRGIITGAWLVAQKQRTGRGSGHWPGGGPGRYASGTDVSVLSEGGIRLERGSRGSGSGCLTYAPCMTELEEIGQVDRGAQDVAAIELSS
jgi:hypothetical protein